MENKINIAELLKDCPSGMELDCTIWDSDAKVFFKEVLNDYFAYPIMVTVKYNNCEYSKSFSKYGAFNDFPYCKCVIFPKGKTTWEGFVPPYKDGDIISDSMGTCIFKGEGGIKGTVNYYCGISHDYFRVKDDKGSPNGHYGNIVDYRLATEEEKRKLFDAIKEHGYKWNAETKTLEKLVKPKFKVGDIIRHRLTGEVYKVLFVLSNGCGGGVYDVAITNEIGKSIDIKEQDNYELAVPYPTKFDISTLIPFESRVLCRDGYTEKWKSNFWGFYDNAHAMNYPFECCGTSYAQCIPYEGNEHLLGTTDDCDDFYKSWEE